MDVKDAIRQLDIEKKARLVTGGGFWNSAECAEIGLPSVKLSDGPCGMRVQEKRPNHLGLGSSLPATCYPSPSAVACSFDIRLCEKLGGYIAREGVAEGVSMVLGPSLNVKRSPLCGRNFDYFSEDSYLSGKLAAAYVRGIQSAGVTACVKHFAVNGREYARMYCDSRVDEQTLRETYLTGFEIAVKEGGAGAVMSAYNKVNGVFCNQNSYLLNTVLREEWGFNGVVVSDWGGSRGRVEALKAGADLEMPQCRFSAAEIVKAVKNGELDESVVDESVERISDFARRSQDIDRQPFDKAEHDRFAQQVAEECMVLLKNEGGALPLKRGERVAVIGDFAQTPRYQGAGSSQINPTSLDNILGAIAKSSLDLIGFAKGFKRFGGKSNRLLSRAKSLAKKADTLVLCLGLDENRECEGADRSDLSIGENQIELIRALAPLNKKIVVVLSCGSPVLTDWDCYADALLLAHLGGQSGARAVVRTLVGEVNPSGRLAESYPLKEGAEPCAEVYSVSPLKTDCAEGIYVGYKYYQSFAVPVKYPFGYGLSYTRFEFSDFSADDKGARFIVRNVGEVAGAAVAQVYIKAPRSNLEVSPSELKAFDKIFLGAGESREVFLPFDEYSFRVWNDRVHRFEAGGIYRVSLNADSARELFATDVEITENNLPKGCGFADGTDIKVGYREYFNSHISPDELPEPLKKGAKVRLDMQVSDLIYCKGLVAKIFGLVAICAKRSKNKVRAMTLDWLSVRSLMQFLKLGENQSQGFLLACDGHFFKGMKKLFFEKD